MVIPMNNGPGPTNLELKIPPHSIEAEQAVLGGLMLDNHAWDHVADRITENDFYRFIPDSLFQTVK